MRKGIKSFGIFLGFCLMPILGMVADGAGVPPPPPPPPPGLRMPMVKRSISEAEEYVYSHFKIKHTGGTKSNNSGANQAAQLMNQIRGGLKLKHADTGSNGGNVQKGQFAKGINLKFTKFIDEKKDTEFLNSVLLSLKALKKGYTIQLGREEIFFNTIEDFLLIQGIIKSEIEKTEKTIKEKLRPSKEIADELRKKVDAFLEGLPLDEAKVRMQKNFGGELLNEEHTYPKAVKFLALTEELRKQEIMSEEDFKSFEEIKEAFRKENTVKVVMEVDRIEKETLIPLRKWKTFQPEILKLVTSTEACALEQMSEEEIKSKGPKIISNDDKKKVHDLDYKIFACDCVIEKTSAILSNLCETAGTSLENFRKYAVEVGKGALQQAFKYLQSLEAGTDPEKRVKDLEKAVRDKIESGTLFALKNPSTTEKLDIKEGIKRAWAIFSKDPDVIDTNKEYDRGTNEWVVCWLKRGFDSVNGDDGEACCKACEWYQKEQAAYIQELKVKKIPFHMPAKGSQVYAAMRDLRDATKWYGETSVFWVSSLFQIMDKFREKKVEFTETRRALLQSQKTVTNQLRASIRKGNDKKLGEPSAFTQQIFASREKMQAKKIQRGTIIVGEEISYKPEEDPGFFKTDPKVENYVPISKKLEKAQAEVAKMQQALNNAGVAVPTEQTDLLKQIEYLERERDRWKREAERLEKENEKLKKQLEEKDDELERQKTEFEKELKSQLDALKNSNQALQDKNQSLQRANRSLSNENATLKKRPVRGGGGISTVYRENKEVLNNMRDELEQVQGSLGAKDAELADKDEQIQSLINENSALRQKVKELGIINNVQKLAVSYLKKSSGQ